MRRFILFLSAAALLSPVGLQAEGPLRERIAKRMAERMKIQAAPGATEYQYGTDPLQNLDYWRAPNHAKAPLIVFVHGGAWSKGDKSTATGENKVSHWQEQGYAVASVDYRQVPDATVEQQAQDIADSIGWLRTKADSLGFDANRIILIGHSAGAHLAALVGTDLHYIGKTHVPASAIKGVVLLDGAAYDVPAQMKQAGTAMESRYEAAFGTDPLRQKALSPALQATAPNIRSFLILHVEREDGTYQSQELANALRKAGGAATVQGLKGKGLRGHMEINRRLGVQPIRRPPSLIAGLQPIFNKW